MVPFESERHFSGFGVPRTAASFRSVLFVHFVISSVQCWEQIKLGGAQVLYTSKNVKFTVIDFFFFFFLCKGLN